MIAPLAFTTTSFNSINKLQEIYEINLPELEHHVQSSEVSIYAYKKVANHIKPITTTLPENFQIVHWIPCDPLESIPVLSTHPPDLIPRVHYTLEWMKSMNINPDGFLWPKEDKLTYYLMLLQQLGFAWTEDNKGKFSSDYFDPITILTIKHIPWVLYNIPIPPGIFH